MLGIDLEKADHGLTNDLLLIAGNVSRALSQLVLRTDVSGMPLEWIDYKEAARLYHQEQVAYTCGSPLFKLYGGVSALTGFRTVLEVNSIVATVGHTGNPGNTRHDYVPPLNNQIAASSRWESNGADSVGCTASRASNSELPTGYNRRELGSPSDCV